MATDCFKIIITTIIEYIPIIIDQAQFFLPEFGRQYFINSTIIIKIKIKMAAKQYNSQKCYYLYYFTLKIIQIFSLEIL